jgi:hypothetical protein
MTNVTVFLYFGGLDFTILMGENSLLGPLDGVGLEKLDFFGPEMALTSQVAISGSTISPHQNHFVPHHINNRYIYS